METRSSLRNKLKSGFCTVTDNHIIRWKPLSIEQYFYYDNISKTGEIVNAVLEDEIFQQCVTDPYYTSNINNLPFGIIGTVSQNIMEHSGPLSVQHFNDVLDQYRTTAQEPLHHLVTLIIRAFPAYKPEDCYAMDFDTFMMRVAQAESLLMMIGVIKEPLSLLDENAPPPKKQKHMPAELRAMWEAQQERVNKKPPPKKSDEPSKGVKFDKAAADPDKSPIFTKDRKHPQYMPLGNLDSERVRTEQTVGTEEESAERAKMVKEAQRIYKDVMHKMEFYKKAP